MASSNSCLQASLPGPLFDDARHDLLRPVVWFCLCDHEAWCVDGWCLQILVGCLALVLCDLSCVFAWISARRKEIVHFPFEIELAFAESSAMPRVFGREVQSGWRGGEVR